MRSTAFISSLLLLASPALADVAPPASPPNVAAESPPGSIWKDVEAGAVTHLQSGLLCPERVKQYARTKIETFDTYGFDVGCNYQAYKSKVTIRLT
jgi:hypothetical protein